MKPFPNEDEKKCDADCDDSREEVDFAYVIDCKRAKVPKFLT